MAAVLFLGMVPLMRGESDEQVVKQDIDRLERFMSSAFIRADRWKCDFEMNVYLLSSTRPYIVLYFRSHDTEPEKFYADDAVRWRFNGTSSGTVLRVTYKYGTHTVSPAFTVVGCNSSRRAMGETLTVSLRGLMTRESS